jgi:hypothetical protein
MTEEHDTALITGQLAELTRVVEEMATQLAALRNTSNVSNSVGTRSRSG